MPQVYQIDTNGYFLEPVIIGENNPIPTNCVATQLPDGLYKAQYVNGQWVEGLDAASILNNAKAIKKAQLGHLFQASLLNGFTSTADGTSRTYAIDPAAMSKWTGALAVINSGKATGMTVKDFNGNTVTLTAAQFQQMAADGFAFFNTQESNLWMKESDVDTAKDVPTVNAITW